MRKINTKIVIFVLFIIFLCFAIFTVYNFLKVRSSVNTGKLLNGRITRILDNGFEICSQNLYKQGISLKVFVNGDTKYSKSEKVSSNDPLIADANGQIITEYYTFSQSNNLNLNSLKVNDWVNVKVSYRLYKLYASSIEIN